MTAVPTAKDVRTEKHWHALCDLCGWHSAAFLTYQTANEHRLAHLNQHILAAQADLLGGDR